MFVPCPLPAQLGEVLPSTPSTNLLPPPDSRVPALLDAYPCTQGAVEGRGGMSWEKGD